MYLQKVDAIAIEPVKNLGSVLKIIRRQSFKTIPFHEDAIPDSAAISWFSSLSGRNFSDDSCQNLSLKKISDYSFTL